MTAIEGAHFGGMVLVASFKVVTHMVAVFPGGDVPRYGAIVVFGLFQTQPFRAVGAAVLVPWICGVAHTGGLHPGNGLVGLPGEPDVVVGRGNAHCGANVFLMIRRQ